MSKVAPTSRTPASSQKSRIPVVSSTKKMKARPAPDFAKLHQKWRNQFETGKACTKKPCTVPQEFEVTRPGTKFQQAISKTFEGEEDCNTSDFDFHGDQEALESILTNQGLTFQTGRATTGTPCHIRRSSSCSTVFGNNRQILGELSCDPEEERRNRRRSRSATKPVHLNRETSKKGEDFEVDKASLQSILSNKGIQPLRTPCKERQTFAAQSAVKRNSIYDHPRSSNVFDSVIPARLQGKIKRTSEESTAKTSENSKNDNIPSFSTGEDFEVDKASLQSILSNKGIQPLRTPCKQRQTFAAQSAGKRNSIYNHPRSSNLFDSVIPAMLNGKAEWATAEKAANTSENNQVSGRTAAAEKQVCTLVDKLTNVMCKTPEKILERTCHSEKNPQMQSDTTPKFKNSQTPFGSDVTTPLSAARVKTKENLEMTPLTPSRVLATNKNMKPLREMATPSPARLLSNVDRLRPNSTKKSLWDSPFGQVVQVPRRDSVFPEFKRLQPFDKVMDNKKGEADKRLSECYMPRRILKKETKTEISSTNNSCQDFSAKKQHVRWADETEHDSEAETSKRRQLFSAIDETDEQEESKENVCPITKEISTSSTNQPAAILSTNRIQAVVQPSSKYDLSSDRNDKAVSRDGKLEKEIAPDVSHGASTLIMAMHTESESDSEGQRSGYSSPSNSRHGTSLHQKCTPASSKKSVEKFVERIETSKKRQSVTELNESISESNVYLHKLSGEASRLQNEQETEAGGHDGRTNILYQLELIKRQKEELIKLQKQLQDQLDEKLSNDHDVAHEKQSRDQNLDETESAYSSRDSPLTNNNIGEVNNNVFSSPLHVQPTPEREYLSNTILCSENDSTSKLHYKSPIWKERVSVARSISLPVFLSSTPTTLSQTVTQSESGNRLNSPEKEVRTPSVNGRDGISFLQGPEPENGELPNILVDKRTFTTPKATKTIYESHLSPYDAFVSKNVGAVAPPIWTPVALKSAAESRNTNKINSNDSDVSLKVTEEPLDLSAKTNVCIKGSLLNNTDQHHVYVCTASHSAITASINKDINVKTVRDMTPNKTFTTQSAFKSLDTGSSIHLSAFSRIKSAPHRDVGSLSLVANFSPAFKRVADDTLRRNVLIHANDHYQEALLDNECELYLCRLQRSSPCDGRGFMNPIARILAEGDDMHFIPIREEKPRGFVHRDGSAFCCYSP